MGQQPRKKQSPFERYQTSPAKGSSKRKLSDRDEQWTITFTEQDLNNVRFPHSKARVISIKISKPTIRRILIDQGSSTEIMYYSAFNALNLNPDHLMLANSLLSNSMGLWSGRWDGSPCLFNLDLEESRWSL